MPVTTPEQLAQRVERGAQWLDQTHPDWHRQISIVELEMACCYACVLGQLHHDYHDVVSVWDTRKLLLHDQAHDYGFVIVSEDGDDTLDDEVYKNMYEELDRLWTRQINNRIEKEETACPQ